MVTHNGEGRYFVRFARRFIILLSEVRVCMEKVTTLLWMYDIERSDTHNSEKGRIPKKRATFLLLIRLTTCLTHLPVLQTRKLSFLFRYVRATIGTYRNPTSSVDNDMELKPARRNELEPTLFHSAHRWKKTVQSGSSTYGRQRFNVSYRLHGDANKTNSVPSTRRRRSSDIANARRRKLRARRVAR